MMLDLVPDVADARAWQIVMLPDDSLLIRRKDPPATADLVEEWRRAGSLRRVQGLASSLRSGGLIMAWRMGDIGGAHWADLLAQMCGAQVDSVFAPGARIGMLRIHWQADGPMLQVRAYLTDGQAYRNASAADVGRLITEATELAGTADRMGRWWAESDGPAAEQDLALARRQQTLAARYQALDDQLADLLHVSRHVSCGTVAP